MTSRRILGAVLLATVALLTVPGAAHAAPPAEHAPLSAVGAPGAVQDVNAFVFESLDVRYELGRDEEGRSTLRTVEHFVAVFPDFDQNRGIQRAIPSLYQGHSTRLEIVSVTDEEGTPRPYETGADGEFLLLTAAVPRGQYVHGEQHYVIEYTQRDVTAHFGDTDDDEFYWDVNGTGWAQPFGEVSATVTLDPSLVPLVTEAACYQGYEGSTKPCDAVAEGDTVRVGASELAPFQNVTVVIAFPTGTFAAAPFDLFAIVPATGVFGIGAGLVSLLFAGIVGLGFWRDARGRGTVIAQYDPPKEVSLFLAAEILGRKSKAMAATLVDLGVRRKLRIVERDGSWGSKDFGLVQLGSAQDPDLLAEEKRMMGALFAGRVRGMLSGILGLTTAEPAVDTASGQQIRWLQKRDTILGQHVIREAKSARTLALRRGLRRAPARWPIAVTVVLTAVGFVLCLLAGTTSDSEPAVVVGVLGSIVTIWLGIGAIAGLATRKPLTREGAELKEHLQGLAEFIRWAEADRLRMLQSVEGAERLALDGSSARPDDPVRVVRIYERLLPYAVLFGLEKQWAAELSKYYAEQSPDWYSGSSGSFAVASFSAGIGSLSSSVAASYSGSSSSSSSGGSGGGGSSGGGGGGGGGGGV